MSDVAEIERLIKLLGSDRYAEREVAQRALVKRGPEIEPVLRRHLDDAAPEVRNRVEAVLMELVRSGLAVDGLQIRLAVARPRFQEWEAIDASLVFMNVGRGTLVVAPGHVELTVSGTNATFQPHPPTLGRGRSVQLPERAQRLESGQSFTVTFLGLDDGHGKWKAGPGALTLQAAYHQGGPKKQEGAWQGSVFTGKVKVEVVPDSEVHKQLVALFKKANWQPAIRVLAGAGVDAELLLMLRDSAGPYRKPVIEALGLRCVRAAVPDLLALAAAMDPAGHSSTAGRNARTAVRALGRIGDWSAARTLTMMLGAVNQQDPRRVHIFDALCGLRLPRTHTIDDVRVFKSLEQYAQSTDHSTAGGALAAQYVLLGKDTVTPLVDDILRDKGADDQKSFHRLKNMGVHAAPKLLELWNASSDPKRVAVLSTHLHAILEKGAYSNEIVEAALRKFGSDDRKVRELPPYVLRGANPAAVADKLAGLLQDRHVDVRRNAGLLLAKFKDPRAVEPLMKLARDHSSFDDALVLQALLEFPDPKIAKDLFAEYPRATVNYQVRLKQLVRIHVKYIDKRPEFRRWLERLDRRWLEKLDKERAAASRNTAAPATRPAAER